MVSKWVHRDEFDSMKALYEIRIANLEDENAALRHEITTLHNEGGAPDEIIDAEIVED